jgi:Putative Actinobacterial Holin-X, holin superfamily III
VEDRRDDRSLGQLFGDLSRQLTTLVRQEIDLARTEVTGKVSTTVRDGALIGLGGALLYAALLGVMATLVIALIDAGLDPWLAALLVSVVVGVIGAGLVMVGRNRLTEADLAPTRTIETIREDVDMAKERVK